MCGSPACLDALTCTHHPTSPCIPCAHTTIQVTKYVQREILNHRRLNHPHIIQLIEVFLTPTHLAIVMEYAPGGDMYNYVLQQRGLAEHDALWFFQQLVIAVDYCHKMVR